jgi:Centromere DNA-binding protein complex CBF3 subunit, domain 2
MRHVNVLLCPVSALAQQLVATWDIHKKHSPDFSSRGKWYDEPVFEGSKINPDTGFWERLCYTTSLKYASAAFKENDIPSKKKTHAGRGQGARDLASKQ